MLKLNTTPIHKMPIIKDYKSKDSIFYSGEGVSNSLTKDMYFDSVSSLNVNKLNKFNKKTVNDISFGGLPLSSVEKITASKTWKLFNANWFKKFISIADTSQSIFDALFALGITCVLRPAAIMVQSTEKTKEKNKKAAAHSISSGVIGYGFAIAIFSPIKKALDKLKKNPEKFAKKAESFFKSSKNAQTFTMLVNKSTEALTASVRSGITIALIPIIDKLILNKLFGSAQHQSSKKDLQNPLYRFSYVNFKNNIDNSKVFQTFTGVMK